MLSAPDFPAFAAKVIPFMHVTTRIPDRKHEKLLVEKGFGGFPSLAFMDAKGDVVAKPSLRTVEGFGQTLEALTAVTALKQRIEAGETGLEAELLFAEYALGGLDAEDFAKRAAACTGLSKEQQARVDQIVLDEKVSSLANSARRGGPGLEKAAAEFIKMLDANALPSQELRYMAPFWGTLGRWAVESADAALARRVAAGIRQNIKDNEAFTDQAKMLEETAARIDSLTAMEKRVEAGEEGLEVDILLLEYDLGKCKAADFGARAEPLLAKADATQQAALKERMREISFLEQLEQGGDPSRRAAAAAAIVELLGPDGQPPEKLARGIWPMLVGYGNEIGDPDLIERALEGMKMVFKGNPNLTAYAKAQEANIAKLRAAKKAAESKAPPADEPESEGDD